MKQKITITPRIFILLLMPVMIFFSYYPMLNFGESEGMHFEISLLQIYLVFFALINIPSIWQNRHRLVKNKIIYPALLFCIMNTLSLLWTPNFIKGLLITGTIWLLFVCFLAFLSFKNFKQLLPLLFKILIVSACINAIFAIFQMFAEVINLPQSISLLCNGCRATQFGFARATGFAIEPQFFGSLLLTPILLLLQKFIKQKSNYKINLCLSLLLVAMFLTMSRGAIYALAIGTVVLFIINFPRLKKILLSLAIILSSFILSLSIQGLSAELNPNINDGFYPAISRTVHQLSLGIIDIRPKDNAKPEPPATTPTTTPILNGYVEESTDTRNFLSQLALKAWSKTGTNLIIGAGTGSTGRILHHYFPNQIDETEITQNQYTEILLENGLIGLIIFITIIVLIFKLSLKHKFLWPIFLSILIQWLFFSGYPNALHIYLFLAICAAALIPKARK